MTPQRLDRLLTVWRISDPDGAHPIVDATGSKLCPGRWNDAGSPLIYASEHYSTATLETLAHGSGQLPPNQHVIEMTIPNDLSYEMVTPSHLPGWDHPSCAVSRTWGRRWQQERRSLLLLVPSVVARMERHVLIDPDHPELGRIVHGLHEPVWWDRRLFS